MDIKIDMNGFKYLSPQSDINIFKLFETECLMFKIVCYNLSAEGADSIIKSKKREFI